MRVQVGIRFARNVRFAILLGCPLIATAWMTQPAAGQSGLASGRVEGVIVDESDAVVPDAAVTANSDATGLSEIQPSDVSGHFLFPYLSLGTYRLSIEKAGFKIALLDNVVVMVGTTVGLRPQLTIGSENVRVVVSAEQPLIDPTRSSVSSVIGQGGIQNLPLRSQVRMESL
jgi:Carboxypeptidase regulatory-like domain